jgi:hypothetical protein
MVPGGHSLIGSFASAGPAIFIDGLTAFGQPFRLACVEDTMTSGDHLTKVAAATSSTSLSTAPAAFSGCRRRRRSPSKTTSAAARAGAVDIHFEAKKVATR